LRIIRFVFNIKRKGRWLVRVSVFFVSDGVGGNEKYIKLIKVYFGWNIIYNFAAEFRKTTKHTKKEIL